MTARTLFVLLLTAGVAAAQEPTPPPTPSDPTPAATTPTPSDPTRNTQPTPTTPAPNAPTTQPMTTQPMTTPPGGVVQGGYVAPMTTYPYQPGQIVQMGYAQSAPVYGTPMSNGYTYPTYAFNPGYTMPAYGYPQSGYVYPSFANGYANSTVYTSRGVSRRLFRR